MHDNESATWLRVLRRSASPRVRLVCFPHAGGSASQFRAWPPDLPGGVDILAARYPGREDRFAEPFATSIDDLVAPLTRACAGFGDAPLALFGHSMGALVAHGVAARLRARSVPVAVLFASSCVAPMHIRDRGIAGSDEEALLAHLRRLGGTESGALDNPELRELVLPAIRADYHVVETYRMPDSPRIDVPVVAYHGSADPGVDAAEAGDWARTTSATFDLRTFDGDHFYLNAHQRALLDDVGTRLLPHVTA